MSKRHPLDDLFKNNLRDASAPVPDNMWQRIAHARQQKRRRLFVIWSALGATTLSLLAVLLLPTHTPQIGSFPLEQIAPLAVTETPLVVNRSVSASSPDKQEHQEILLTPKKADASLPTSKQGRQNKTATASATKVNLGKLIRKTRQEKLASNTVSPQPNQLESLSEQPKTSEKVEPPSETPPRIAGPHQRIRHQAIANLPAKNLVFAQQTELKLFANHAPRCARFANPYFRFDLEVLGGPAYAQQVLKAKTPESISHLEKRQESEAPGLSYSSGFRLAAASTVGLNLRTGLMYTQINDRFTFEVGGRMDVSTTWGPNGEVVSVDTTYIAAYEDQRRNRLRFVEIPLLMGYEQQWGKFRVGVNAGAFLNVHFGTQGAIYSPATQEPTEFGQQGDREVLPIFAQRATAAWYAGLSLAYNLHSRYSLIAEPYFKSYPRALSSSAYDLQQNYWMTGLQLGMRMRL